MNAIRLSGHGSIQAKAELLKLIDTLRMWGFPKDWDDSIKMISGQEHLIIKAVPLATHEWT